MPMSGRPPGAPSTKGRSSYPRGVPSTEVVIARHDPCAWLPEGGLAEVVWANGSAVPHPTPVARVLITEGDAILAVERDDGRGLDIPTAAVTSDLRTTLQGLMSSVLSDGEVALRLLGFVRNTVPAGPGSYPWPRPIAHFAVWHCRVNNGARRRGRWLDRDEAQAHLGMRHWWPLADHVEA